METTETERKLKPEVFLLFGEKCTRFPFHTWTSKVSFGSVKCCYAIFLRGISPDICCLSGFIRLLSWDLPECPNVWLQNCGPCYVTLLGRQSLFHHPICRISFVKNSWTQPYFIQINCCLFRGRVDLNYWDFDCNQVVLLVSSRKSDLATESKFERGRMKIKYTWWLHVLWCFPWKGRALFYVPCTVPLYSHITHYVNK